MFNSNVPSVADIAAVTDNNRNGFGGDGGWWILIILLALFGGWGRGGAFGGAGAGGVGSETALATSADLQRGFNNQEVMDKLNGFENAFAQLGYDQLGQMNAINSNISTTGFNIQNAIQQAQDAQMQGTNAIQSQIADCCCQTQRAIDGVNYNMSQNFCQLGNTIQNAARDITDNQNANYRALHDEIVANRMEDKNAQIAQLQSQVQALNLAQSQANQNTYLVNALRPTPVPSYAVPNPFAYYGCGSNYGCNTGCGC